MWMMGVCDGHGIHGHLVSNFVKVNLPKILADLIKNGNKNNNLINDYASSPGKGNNRNGPIFKNQKPPKLNQSFLPPLTKRNGKGKQYEIDGSSLLIQDDGRNINSESEGLPGSLLGEQWLQNENQKVRDA